MTLSDKAAPILVIGSENTQNEYLKDLFRYRELLYFFIWRDILVRYRQAFFGIAWALFRPFLNMLGFTFLFGTIARLPSENVSYGLLVLAGLLPWQLCANGTVDTCSSLVNYSHLISKIYFPRAIVPLAQLSVHLVDFCIGMVMLICLTLFLQGTLYWSILALPLFILLTLFFCIALGLWLSAFTVQYRDFRLVIPFFVQFGMFISPVGYITSVIPEHWQWLYFLNPMVGIIDGFRWTMFGIYTPHFTVSLIYCIAVTGILLKTGFHYFRCMERTFADRI